MGQCAQSEGLYTDFCGTWNRVMGSNDDAAGELEIWYHERKNVYLIYAGNTEGDGMVVCKVIDVLTLHFQKCTDKIKTLLV